MIVATACGYLLIGVGVGLNSLCRNLPKMKELTDKNVADNGKAGKFIIPLATAMAVVAWPYALHKIYENNK